MPKVRLLRRLGQNPDEAILDRSPREAEWLVHKGYAEPVLEELPDAPAEVIDPPRPAVVRGGRR